MASIHLRAVPAVMVLVSLACAKPAPPQLDYGPPRVYDVAIVGALVGPGKAIDDAVWDGFGPISREATDDIAALAGLFTAGVPTGEQQPLGGALLNEVANKFAQGLARPDVYGTFSLVGPASYQDPGRYDLASQVFKDTYTPHFGGGFKGLDFSAGNRIRIELFDEDFENDDPIGTAEINAAHVEYAATEQGVVGIWVGDQTNGQVLFINISAVPVSLTD